jgi:integrase
MLVDVNEKSIEGYQNRRLEEHAAPKSINEEVGCLLRLMNENGDILRARLRKKNLLKLKVRQTVGKAYAPEEKVRMLEQAKIARSPHIYPALMLALNAGMRDAEIKNLTWAQIDFASKFLVVGNSKTDAGEGRTIPLNSTLFEAMGLYREWYVAEFGATRPDADELLDLLKHWRQTAQFSAAEDWMFASQYKLGRQPLGYTYIWNKLGNAARKAGIGHVSSHTFRHTSRMWPDSVGTPVGVQQKLMRHADIRTTMNIYGDADSADMRNAHEKVVHLAIPRP